MDDFHRPDHKFFMQVMSSVHIHFGVLHVVTYKYKSGKQTNDLRNLIVTRSKITDLIHALVNYIFEK